MNSHLGTIYKINRDYNPCFYVPKPLEPTSVRHYDPFEAPLRIDQDSGLAHNVLFEFEIPIVDTRATSRKLSNMSLTKAVDDLKSYLHLGSVHQNDHMYEALQKFINEESFSKMLLTSQQEAIDLESFSTFMIRSRQVVDRQCGKLIEKVLFYFFRSIPTQNRHDVIHQLDKIIKFKTASQSEHVSKVLLVNSYGPPDRNILGVKDKQRFPELFRLFPEHGNPYEDFELTGEEVKRIFKEVEVLVNQSTEPNIELIKLFNDFLVLSCFNAEYSFIGD